MKRMTLMGGFLLLTLATGCPSPAELCRTGVDQVCERSFECQSTEVKASPQFQAAFGTSIEDCKRKLYANPLAPAGATGLACESVESDQQLCANLGQPDKQKFKLGPASECASLREDMACPDYLAQLQDASRAPAVCAQRCE
jgi:hypothetical protein